MLSVNLKQFRVSRGNGVELYLDKLFKKVKNMKKGW